MAGFAIDAGSGHRELTFLFAALYVIGCVAAVLAVRQSGLFTAVVQPPLVLFIAVPTAYFLFHHAEIHGVKDILINCGYPLIERFLLMFTTSLAVLLIGMARWYFGAAGRAGKATPEAATAVGAGLVAGVAAKITALLNRRTDDTDESAGAEPADRVRRPRKHTIDRPTAGARRPRERRTTNREAPSRSRHARPPMDDLDGPERAPRRRYASHRMTSTPIRGRRRPAGAARRANRARAPRCPSTGRVTGSRRNPRSAPRRSSRYESAYEPYEPYGSYESPEPYDAPPAPSTHHPFSNVRYRGSTDDDEDRQPLSAATAQLISDGRDGFRAAARTPAFRWRSSPVARCRNRVRRGARGRRAPEPPAPTRPTSHRQW